LCVALSSFVTSSGASALDAASGVTSTGAGRTVKFRDGTMVPALGQGSAGLGKGRHPIAEEEAAVRTGLSLGMTLIDTAEIYGSEEFIGRVIAGQRNRVFLVSKVWPSHVARNGIARACEASLARLGTDHLDLYLLHWPNGVTDFSHVVRAFEDLHAAGKIRAWGVSNFKVSDMEKLFRIPQGDRCATNQVPYSLDDRGIERGLLPWCERHGMPVTAYSPLGGPGASLLRDPTLCRYGRTARFFGSRRCAGLDHPQWSRDCNSRIWFCRACKGERRRADTDADATGTSNTGCSPSAAEPLTEGIDLNQNALWTEQRPDGAAGLGGSALEMTSPATRFSAPSSRGRVHSATVLG